MNKGLLAVIALFFGFWLFTDPGGMAGAAESASSWAWAMTQDLFTSVIDFIAAF
jgi:hypothetical protein